MTLTSQAESLPVPVDQIRRQHSEELEAIARYRRVTNYLAAAQIYLKDNALLQEPLKPEHIKDRLLGHCGVPAPASTWFMPI